jgi:hypothetical protein
VDDVIGRPGVRLVVGGRALCEHVEHRRRQQVRDRRQIRLGNVEHERDRARCWPAPACSLLAGADAGAAPAMTGAAVPLAIVLVTVHAWLLGAVAIDVAIAVVALT